MHTYIDEGDPLFSKLVFTSSPDTIDDGLLNTYEIYGIRLKCRLAIISACRSGDGRLLQGEGILSLARGFQYAGCPALIAAQWRIDDFSGADVIASFAKNIKKGMTVSKALQLAQTGFIANADPLRSHPYFWASYQLIGNNAPIYYSTQVVVMFWVLLPLMLAAAGFLIASRIRNRKLKRIE
jgi:CHAT domain-containing protein